MDKQKGVSLHIGLNRVDPQHYTGWSGPLNACEADAEDMEGIGKKQGFATKVLKTEAATRNAVTSAILDAAKNLSSGDIFFLSYSGHGGQLPDTDGDEPDLKDETWCLYDGQMVDDELHSLWSHFNEGVRILVLSDSCHSGTVIKMMAFDALGSSVGRTLGLADVQYRFMPDEVALRTYRHHRKRYNDIAKSLPSPPSEVTATVRLISGCQDNQLSMDGTFNGLFTGTLLRVWNDGNFKGNYSGFHEEILRRMPPTQSPKHFLIGKQNLTYDAQKPFTI